jgi:hypothetical protein
MTASRRTDRSLEANARQHCRRKPSCCQAAIASDDLDRGNDQKPRLEPHG